MIEYVRACDDRAVHNRYCIDFLDMLIGNIRCDFCGAVSISQKIIDKHVSSFYCRNENSVKCCCQGNNTRKNQQQKQKTR